jgi:hypothetical protein
MGGMKPAKKRRADHGAAWSDESEASILFFKQGEANAAADLAAYQSELAEAARPSGLRRWWMVAAAAIAVIAILLYVAVS